MSDKTFNLPISTFCETCGSDLEIADFDTVRVGEKMTLQFNVKTCERCKEAWQEAGADSADVEDYDNEQRRKHGFY